MFASILIHELTHLLVGKIFGDKARSIRILPVGLNVQMYNEKYSTWKASIILASGPLANLFIFAAGIVLKTNTSVLNYIFKPELLNFFIFSNLYLAIFNLLPLLPLDGGKLLYQVLSSRVGLIRGFRYTKRVSVFLAAILVFIGIIQLIKNILNFSLVLVGIYIIFYLRFEGMEAAIMNLKYIISRRSRLLKKGVYPARDLVVVQSFRIGEILKNMDFDRFHLIHVLDGDLKIVGVLTEQEVMEGMVKYSSDITFEEFMKM